MMAGNGVAGIVAITLRVITKAAVPPTTAGIIIIMIHFMFLFTSMFFYIICLMCYVVVIFYHLSFEYRKANERETVFYSRGGGCHYLWNHFCYSLAPSSYKLLYEYSCMLIWFISCLVVLLTIL